MSQEQQQDFWAQFEGNVDGSAEATNVESLGFESINGGSLVPMLCSEATFTDNQSAIDHAEQNGYEAPKYEKFYNFKWTVIGGDYEKRVIFQKVRPWKFDAKGNPDQKAATRQANMLRRIMMLTECPIPTSVPQTSDLAACLSKPVVGGIALWENKNARTGTWSNGNWVSSIDPITADFEPVTGKVVPKHDGQVDDVDGSGSTGSNNAGTGDKPGW